MVVRNILQHDFLMGLGRHFTQIKIWNNSEIKKVFFRQQNKRPVAQVIS